MRNPWVKEAHLGSKVNAGYMTLVNTGPKAVTLLKVESEDFESIEMHEMVRVDGLMEMHEVTGLVIPAHGQVHLKPGGKHLMLMGPREYLTKGRKVDMTIIFKSGKKQMVSVKVKVAAREGLPGNF
ncbi:MAG: copper chaperone PCu(A)C [Pseudomonadota bacterium]|nr:copper chaperone PCu(A)C [Pseudomonadota bacterium]